MSTATALINGETVELVLLGTEDEELRALDIPVVDDAPLQKQQLQAPGQLTRESPTDSYGFYLESEDNDSCHKCLPQPPSVLKLRSAKEKERLTKWLVMKRAWTSSSTQRKVKERSRKGIPDQMRDWGWYNMSAAKEVSVIYPSTAAVLTSNALQNISATTMEDIERDIPRTFPRHKLFAAGVGQQALRRVLQCYAVHDPIVGYCQVSAPSLTSLPSPPSHSYRSLSFYPSLISICICPPWQTPPPLRAWASSRACCSCTCPRTARCTPSSRH